MDNEQTCEVCGVDLSVCAEGSTFDRIDVHAEALAVLFQDLAADADEDSMTRHYALRAGRHLQHIADLTGQIVDTLADD